MSLASVLEGDLRPSKRCPEGSVWNPARQRCQDRFTGEPTLPDPTYPQEDTNSSLLLIMLEMMKLTNAIMNKSLIDKESDSGTMELDG